MKKTVFIAILVAAVLSAAILKAEEKKAGKPMSKEKMIKLALSGAPMHISENAAVMIPGEDGKLAEARKGTNGFTCIPTVNNRPGEPDPACFDEAAGQFFNSM